MKIVFKIGPCLTLSGKPSLSFSCEHCHSSYLNLDGFFYQTTLVKDDLETDLQVFVSAINQGTVGQLFNKAKTGIKLYRNHLCNCTPGIVDINYIKSVKRAKQILEAGLEMMNDKRE